MSKLRISVLALSLASSVAQAGLLDGLRRDDPAFLPAEEAFMLSAVATGGNRIEAHWNVAPDYYLYRHRLAFRLLDADDVELARITLPAGTAKTDEHFGEVEVYYETLTAVMQLGSMQYDRELTLEVQY